MTKKKKIFNCITYYLIFVFIIVLLTKYFSVYAVDINPPSLVPDAQVVIERIFNIVFASVAGVLVAVLAFGIWKSSLATGDPRGLEGAKQTWNYALYGFMAVVLFFAIFAIAQKILGVPVLTPQELLTNVFSAIQSLIESGQSDNSNSIPRGGGGGGIWKPPVIR